uniref:alpha-L-fucosidase n=1 Tax=Macrostomum lignano TaxID=282301 RepID=A0A1I8FDZ9_9PLAT
MYRQLCLRCYCCCCWLLPPPGWPRRGSLRAQLAVAGQPAPAGLVRPGQELASSFTGACSPCQGSATSVLVAAGAGVPPFVCGLSKPVCGLYGGKLSAQDSPMPTLPGSFKAELFNPEAWADTLSRSGAKYVVLTSKHHEGYCLWNTSHSFIGTRAGWLRSQSASRTAAAIRNRSDGPRFGVYHSLYEMTLFAIKTMAELYELVNQYRPEVIWSDGDAVQCATPVVHQRQVGLRHLRANTAATSPARTVTTPGKLVSYKFENAMTLIKGSWGYVRNLRLTDIYSLDEMLETVVSTLRWQCPHEHCPTSDPCAAGVSGLLLQLGRPGCQSTSRLCTIVHLGNVKLVAGGCQCLLSCAWRRPASAWRRQIRRARRQRHPARLSDGGSACPARLPAGVSGVYLTLPGQANCPDLLSGPGGPWVVKINGLL